MFGKGEIRILDGGMGTLLQAAGLSAGVDPCEWNLERSESILAVHKAYCKAGAQVVLTNTFGANRIKRVGAVTHPPQYEVAALVKAGCEIARKSGASKVALDIGPTGKLLKPAGDLGFEDAVSAFGEVVRSADDYDIVFIETMSDLYEVKAAVIAAKENSDKPIFVTVALQEDGRLLTGASIEAFSALMEAMGVDAYGFNCGLGPDKMIPFVERLKKVSTKPIIAKPNAGMPRLVNGETKFEVGPEEFAKYVIELRKAGATIIGGCCGTTPEHIRSIV